MRIYEGLCPSAVIARRVSRVVAIASFPFLPKILLHHHPDKHRILRTGGIAEKK